ncbi:FtsW/RodA/SpoVE family cell cycle protein, partial [Aerococcus urinaeequi]
MSTESNENKAQAITKKQKEINALDKAKAKKQSKKDRKQAKKDQKQAKKERKHEGPTWIKRVLAHFEDFNGKIFSLYGLLLTIGLLMVTTASSYLATSASQPTYYYLVRQLMFAGIGLFAIILIYITKPEMWRHRIFQTSTYLGVTALLIFTTIFG